MAWEVFTGMNRTYYADFDEAMAQFVKLDKLGRKPYFYEMES